MLTLTTLASGSSGNCTLISAGDCHILIDAGISCRRIATALATLDLTPADLLGVIITHEHTDHTKGLATLCKQFQTPLFSSVGTAREVSRKHDQLATYFTTCSPDECFSIGLLTIQPFRIMHDGVEPFGFSVAYQDRKLTVVTDLGVVTKDVTDAVSQSHLVLLEANHDVDWLRTGDYPYYLKERVLGNHGHLSNEAGGALARSAVEQGAHTIILGHLSKDNNTPARAFDVVSNALLPYLDGINLVVAPRDEMGKTYPV